MRGVLAATCLVVGALTSSGCGLPTDDHREDPTWARRADEIVIRLERALDTGDRFESALFFSAGGTLDATGIGFSVATTPVEVAELMTELWFLPVAKPQIRAEHLFVSDEGAVVWWHSRHRYAGAFQNFAQTFVFGANDRVASRLFLAPGIPFLYPGIEEESADAFLDRYVGAWAGDPSLPELDELYTDDAIVRDPLRGRAFRGVTEIAASRTAGLPVERGPFPTIFLYDNGDHREAIVLVQSGGPCPVIEARRLIFAGDRILHELRYVHVPSARRCREALPDGWWTTFSVRTDLRDNVTEIVDSNGSSVELVNAEPVHEQFARWLTERFLLGGIGPPEVAAVWFPPSPDCYEQDGLAIESDVRYERERAVVICFDERRVVSTTSESGWSTPALTVGLHEFAHLWMRERLGPPTEDQFVHLVEATTWRDDEQSGLDRHSIGAEHAAYTIAWGLAGTADARYPLLPPPSCEELGARYELLTGRAPITECGEDGWSQ